MSYRVYAVLITTILLSANKGFAEKSKIEVLAGFDGANPQSQQDIIMEAPERFRVKPFNEEGSNDAYYFRFNVKVINQIIPNIEEVLKDVHATILSPENSDECKPCPISLVESLAHGRPLLASNQVGIANLIEQEGCGVVFAPDPAEAKKAVRKLQNNYTDYMAKAQPTALKYFSLDRFVHEYERLYSKLGIE